jgi:hypothetical protein
MRAQDERRHVNDFSRGSLKLQQYRRPWPHHCQSVNEIAQTRSTDEGFFLKLFICSVVFLAPEPDSTPAFARAGIFLQML